MRAGVGAGERRDSPAAWNGLLMTALVRCWWLRKCSDFFLEWRLVDPSWLCGVEAFEWLAPGASPLPPFRITCSAQAIRCSKANNLAPLFDIPTIQTGSRTASSRPLPLPPQLHPPATFLPSIHLPRALLPPAPAYTPASSSVKDPNSIRRAAFSSGTLRAVTRWRSKWRMW